MKKLLVMFALLILAVSASADFFGAKNVKTELDIGSSVDIRGPGRLDSLQANILFVPIESKNLKVDSLTTEGSELSDRIRFDWSRPTESSFDFGYKATVTTINDGVQVHSKIPFPTKSLRGYEDYLKPTPNIDSGNPAVIAKARELVEGEDDLFVVVGKLATWVKDNVKYNLSTLTAEVSKPASWVLQNKVGVCDEITSLFIAMLRSQRVPAKFVSGVSYTTSPSFPTGWGAHGWAEVYFPGVGWISFDPTFGQLGWIDPGHIKLKESYDPSDSTVQVEWRGGNVDIVVHDLDVNAKLISTTGEVQSPIIWGVSTLHPSVGFGSYNLIVADVENRMDYYVGGQLSLARVDELVPFDPHRVFVLRPGERRRMFWKVRVRPDLDASFQYEIPLQIYDVRNNSQKNYFATTNNDVVYSESSIDGYVASQSITELPTIELACALASDRVLPGEDTSVECRVLNRLDQTTEVEVCYDSCETVRVMSDGHVDVKFPVIPNKSGSTDVVVIATSSEGEIKSMLTLIQLDSPSLSVENIELPSEVSSKAKFEMKFTVKKQSISIPQNVTVYIKGGGAKVNLPLGDLTFDQDVVITVDASQLYGSNPTFDIDVSYEDAFGEKYSQQAEAGTSVTGIPWYKKILGWITGLFD
jgi:transglutaminase-like putative cysteine protease